MTNGWIKIHRQFIEWEWYSDTNMVRLFLHLLLVANHKDAKWRGHEIKRGQTIAGVNSLSEATGLSVQNVRTCLKRLQETGEINKQSNNRFSFITICNYDKYQAVEDGANKPDNKQATNKQQATNHKQECKEGKELSTQEKFIQPTLKNITDYCQERSNGIDPQAFIDHYSAVGWMVGKNKMKDWKAAVRTWEGKRRQEEQKPTVARKRSREDLIREYGTA